MALDTIMGLTELADHFGVHKQTVVWWRKEYSDFPASIGTVSGNPAWWLSQVAAWRERALDSRSIKI